MALSVFVFWQNFGYTYAGCPGLSLVISAQFTLEMCVAAQNRQKKFMNTPILVLKVIQGLCFRCQSKNVCTTSYPRLNGSSSHVLTATSFSYGKARNSTPT